MTAATAAAFVALAIASLGLITWKWLDAEHQRNIANQGKQQLAEQLVLIVDAFTTLVEDVQHEMRNHPELRPLKLKILTKAESNLAKLAKVSGDSAELIDIKIRATFTLARLRMETGGYELAEPSYLTALQLTQLRLVESPRSRKLLELQSDILWGLGTLSFDKHDAEATRDYYQQAFDLDQKWAAWDDKNPKALSLFARSADNLGDTYVLLNERNWEEARGYHEIALRARKKMLSVDEDDFLHRFDCIDSHVKIGDTYFGENDKTTAMDWFEKALEFCEDLEKDFADSIKIQRFKAGIQERIADSFLDAPEKSFDFYVKSIKTREAIAPKLEMDRNFQRDLAIGWGRLALLLSQQNKHQEAVDNMEKCLSIIQGLTKRIPDDYGLKIDEMITLYQLAKTLQDDDERVQELLAKALTIADRLVAEKVVPEDFEFVKALHEAIENNNASGKE